MEKQPTGRGPEGCDENGPAAALLVGRIWIQICSAPRALPTAHSDRYEWACYFGDRTLVGLSLLGQLTIRQGA